MNREELNSMPPAKRMAAARNSAKAKADPRTKAQILGVCKALAEENQRLRRKVSELVSYQDLSDARFNRIAEYSKKLSDAEKEIDSLVDLSNILFICATVFGFAGIIMISVIVHS